VHYNNNNNKKMETKIGKKRSRGGGAAAATSTAVTVASGPVVGDPLKDLIFQFPDPRPTSAGSNSSHQQQQPQNQQQQQQLVDYSVLLPTSDGSNSSHQQQLQQQQQQLVDYSDIPGPSDTMMEQSIQSSLVQLGSDISQIKTQLEKKKAKATLVDVCHKLDWIINYLMKGGGDRESFQ